MGMAQGIQQRQSNVALIRHLRHPNVLRVYSFEVDTEHERVFVVMELLRGPTLDRLLCDRPSGQRFYNVARVAAGRRPAQL